MFEESAEQVEQLRLALDPGGHVGEAVDHTEEETSRQGTKGGFNSEKADNKVSWFDDRLISAR